MKPAYQIRANGLDITEKLSDCLVSLTITDEAGFKSDAASIVIDDRDWVMAIPEVGARLDIALGMDRDLFAMGTFVVDGVGGDLLPGMMRLSAKAADMVGAIRARQTREWNDVSLGSIVSKIAGEHGLKSRVSDALKDVRFPYLAQTAESDLHFLTRLARDLDAVAKPAGQSLIFVPRGEGKAGNGSLLPVVTILRSAMQPGGRWELGARGVYGKVTAEWANADGGGIREVTKGDKAPELRLPQTYGNEEAAARAAQAALEKAKRASTISIDLAGFWPELMAEVTVSLPDIRPGLAGQWVLKKVTHTLSGPLTTSFDAERKIEEKTS